MVRYLRAFVESESETETTQKKKSTPSPLDQTTNSILIEDLKNKKTDIIEKTQEILEKEEQVRHSNLTPVVQSISEENLEKLPPCSSLFETNRATLEILNEQIIMSENNTTKEAPESDSESIELVFDLDSQLIDEKRRVDINKIENDPRKDLILKEESKESSDSDSEIILDLDNNTIIRQNSSIQQESATSSTSKSSITITKIGDLKKQ
ncbi:unnamed protein product [Brachionus calyciflorus]|uniref:Uncharacterized protein n=1 Tax=Brachionus calyciflorus TaxID=104777 RepID=A0A814A5H7_9BILA|nr:unnamed protein product [Brachionus calyciflorus]